MTKRRVEMRSAIVDRTGATHLFVYTDHVRPDILNAYVRMAEQAFQAVTVSDEPDAGPGGYDGPTHVPYGLMLPATPRSPERWIPLEHPLAGKFYPATGEQWHPDDPANPVHGGVNLNNPVATARHLGVSTDELPAHPEYARKLAAHLAEQED